MEEYFNNPFKELEEIRLRDHSRKDIGDKINVINFSSVSHINGDDLDTMDLEGLDFNTYFLVIQTNCRVLFKTEYHEYKQDLVIADMQTKKQYRVMSGHVKLF